MTQGDINDEQLKDRRDKPYKERGGDKVSRDRSTWKSKTQTEAHVTSKTRKTLEVNSSTWGRQEINHLKDRST